MTKKSDTYTIFVLPDSTSKPYGFSIRKKTVRFLVGFLSIAIMAIFGFVAQSVSLLENVAELSALREESTVQRNQIRSVLESVDSLKQQMTRLLELDEKLRVMTDLSPKKRSTRGLAQGGTEEQVEAVQIDENDMALLEDDLSWDQQTQNEREAVTNKLIAGLEQDIARLQKQIADEEESFKELIDAISAVQLRWARMPSIWPVKGWVTSNFGLRTSPFTGRLVMHNGVDISSHRGTPVLASADGAIQRVSIDNDLGRGIFINHGYGKMTIYGHLDRQIVRKGQSIARGDVIGYVGSTGKSTGPHLHYEVRINNVPVDPMRFILN